MTAKPNGKLNYNLQGFDEVVEALGGIKEVSRLTRRSASQVCQWRTKFGGFPSEHYLTISKGLLARGYGAPPHLFTFERPSE
jgi:hypothetical protein